MGENETTFAQEVATELGEVIVGKTEALEARIRQRVEKEIREKLEAEQQQKIQDGIDDALARYAPEIRGGDAGIARGMISLKQDPFLAKQAQMLMAPDQWQPVVVSMSEGENVKESEVRKALTEFLSGGPISKAAIGGDQEMGILMSVMEACEQKVKIDPHAGAIVNSLTNYTVGTGLEYSCSVEGVEDVLRSFAQKNGLRRRIKKAVIRAYTFGEHYFFYYIDPDTGDTFLRDRTKPYEIRAIQTHPEDIETRLAYGRIKKGDIDNVKLNTKYDWFADAGYWDQRKHPDGGIARGTGRMSRRKLVQMVKMGGSDELRGTPRMYPVLRYLRYYEDFVLDRIILNHERSKVVWVRKITGNRDIEGGRAQYGPVGGQVLTETPQIEWKIVNPQINASDSQPDARMMRLTIATGVRIPEHILFQDASEQVYASIRSQDTPFSYDIRSSQQDWVDDAESMFRMVIREKVRAGKLPDQTDVEVFTTEAHRRLYDELFPLIAEGGSRQEALSIVEALSDESPTKTVKIDTVDVKVDTRFPEIVQQDPLKMAQESEILDRIGIFSRTELAARHGGNYKQTAKLKNLEKDWVDEPEEEDADDGERNRGRGSFGKKSGSPTDKPDPDDE
jgi:hypothetical protein